MKYFSVHFSNYHFLLMKIFISLILIDFYICSQSACSRQQKKIQRNGQIAKPFPLYCNRISGALGFINSCLAHQHSRSARPQKGALPPHLNPSFFGCACIPILTCARLASGAPDHACLSQLA